MMYLLQQTTKDISRGSDVLFQYGVLGLFTLILLYVVYYFNKKREKSENEMKEEMKEMKSKMKDDQDKHEKFIVDQYSYGVKVIEKCTDVLVEVKEVLRNRE